MTRRTMITELWVAVAGRRAGPPHALQPARTSEVTRIVSGRQQWSPVSSEWGWRSGAGAAGLAGWGWRGGAGGVGPAEWGRRGGAGAASEERTGLAGQPALPGQAQRPVGAPCGGCGCSCRPVGVILLVLEHHHTHFDGVVGQWGTPSGWLCWGCGRRDGLAATLRRWVL